MDFKVLLQTLLDNKTLLLTILGSSGGLFAACRLILDLLDYRRKKHEAERKENETISSFIRDLEKEEYSTLYKQIKRNSTHGENGEPISTNTLYSLRNYAAKLEDIGAALDTKLLSRSKVYDYLGEKILTCAHADFLWESEDPNTWVIFNKLVLAMEKEKTSRSRFHLSTWIHFLRSKMTR